MDIAQFELVYKPQSPVGPADTVLQGFFLEITNLEAVTREYAMSLTTSSITDPDRRLFGNAAVLVDTPGTNNVVYSLLGAPDASTFRLNRRIVVAPQATALVAVLPSDPFPPGSVGAGSANFECRGYVSLRLPAVPRFTVTGSQLPPSLNVAGSFKYQPQGTGPQKALVTAQSRAIYLDRTTGAAKGQTQSSIPLVTGKALIEIKPDPVIFFPPGGFTLSPDIIGSLPDDLGNMLATCIAAAEGTEGFDRAKFNDALGKAGIGMRLEGEKVA